MVLKSFEFQPEIRRVESYLKSLDSNDFESTQKMEEFKNEI